MDPYLEDETAWRGVHARLINECAAQLQPQLKALGYYVEIEEQIYLSDGERTAVPDAVVRTPDRPTPDRPTPERLSASAAGVGQVADEPVLLAEVREEDTLPFLEIVWLEDRSLVTVIEVVSPTNKFAGRGRLQYLRKRSDLEAAGVCLVEIDLLRRGPRVWAVPEARLAAFAPLAYLVTLTRGFSSPLFGYPLRLRDRLPRIRVPLRDGEPEAALNLQTAFDAVYDRGPYDIRIDYTADPPPPRLPHDDLDWIDALLKAQGLR